MHQIHRIPEYISMAFRHAVQGRPLFVPSGFISVASVPSVVQNSLILSDLRRLLREGTKPRSSGAYFCAGFLRVFVAW